MNEIRPVTLDDAAAIAAIYNFYIENTIISFEEAPVSVPEMKRRIAGVTENYPWLVFERNGEMLGYTYVGRFQSRCAYRHSVEVSIYLSHREKGKGLGTRLFEELFSVLKAYPVHAVIGGAALPNESSVGLLEKFGFEKVAHYREVGFKFGRWIDVGYWEKLLPSGEIRG